MPTTICVINQKGGCGKSTTCFHLAGSFAAAGRRTLLIDVDPQGSLSQGFFGPTVVENLLAEESISAIFSEKPGYVTPTGLIRETGFTNLKIVAANQHLAAFNTPHPETTGLRQFALREFLATVSGFEIVLIDCPPNLYPAIATLDVCVCFVYLRDVAFRFRGVCFSGLFSSRRGDSGVNVVTDID